MAGIYTAGAIVGGSLIGGLFGSAAASNQAAASDRQTAEASRQYDIGNALALQNEDFTRQQMLPGQVTGYGALNNLNILTGQGGTYVPGREELMLRNEYQNLQQGRNVTGSGANQDQAMSTAINAFSTAGGEPTQNRMMEIEGLLAGYDEQAANYNGGQSAQDLLQSDPSYQWRFEQGQDAAQNSMSTNRRGGSFARAMTDYGQGAASQEYQNVFNRNATLAGYATPSTGTGQGVINSAQAGGGNVLNAMGNQINTAGGSASAWGNAATSGISGLTGIYQQNQLMNAMNPGGSGGAGYVPGVGYQNNGYNVEFV